MKKCLMTLAAVLCCTFLFTACSNVDNSGEPSVEAYAKATKTIAGYSFHTSEEMLAALDLTIEYYDNRGKIQTEALTSKGFSFSLETGLPSTVGACLKAKLKEGVDLSGVENFTMSSYFSYYAYAYDDVRGFSIGYQDNEQQQDINMRGDEVASWLEEHDGILTSCVIEYPRDGFGPEMRTWSTVSLSSIKAAFNAGIDCSEHLGKYVNSSGYIIPNPEYAVGRVAYISNEPVDIDLSAENTRILVLANSDLGDFQWKKEISGGEDNFTQTNSMHGLQFCSTHNNDLYPAAKAAYNWDAGRPSGATNWFLPSMQQMTLMLPVAKAEGTGKMSSGHYWVANENLPVVHAANYYDFREGGWHAVAKTDNLKVRACYAY